MKIDKRQSEGLQHIFSVEVKAEDLKERLDERLKSLAPEVKMPGFRPGKVPLSILKKRYGQAAEKEILEKIASEAVNSILKEHTIKPAVTPTYDFKTYEEGKDFHFTLTIEALPEFQLKDLKGLELQDFKVEIEEKKITETLEKIAQENRKTSKISKSRKTKEGDVVVIDFDCTVDGKAVKNGAAQDYKLELGSKSFIEGFEEQLIGVKDQEDKVLHLTFPKEYTAQDLAGKDAIFNVKIKEIHEYLPVKIDEDLAKSLGLKSLEDLKEAVKSKLTQEYKNVVKEHQKQNILNIFDEIYQFDVPQGMVDLEFKNICYKLAEERPADQNEQSFIEANKKAWEKEYYPIAQRRVRLGLVLAEIARQNKIEVTQDEVSQAIADKARQFPGQERQVFDYYMQNKEAIASLRAPLLEHKVIDFITTKAQLKESKITPEKLMQKLEDLYEEDKGKQAVQKPVKEKTKKAQKAK